MSGRPIVATELEPSVEQIEDWKKLSAQEGFARTLARFENHLGWAAEVHKGGETRESAQIVINATVEFLLDVPRLSSLNSKNLEPFAKLMAALNDVDKGIAPPLFSPEMSSHRPPQPGDRHAVWAYAAGTMEIFISYLGTSKDEAARGVYQQLCSSGINIGGPHSDTSGATTVSYWRDKIRRQKADDFVTSIYDRVVREGRSLAEVMTTNGKSPEAIKRLILLRLGNVCGGLFPKKST